MGLTGEDRVMVHSSMKAIGQVEGGADGVLDALMDYFRTLLVLPTHTWATIGWGRPVCDLRSEPSCVGLLTNRFMKRPGVLRSCHPTHSVAASGFMAGHYVSGEIYSRTPCARGGCWGKLLSMQAKILFVGCPLSRNTFIHGVEEWNHIPNRLDERLQPLWVVTADGRKLPHPQHRHEAPCGDVSANYDKLLPAFLAKGIATEGRLGDAVCYACDAAGMYALTSQFLARNPDLFADHEPIDESWYR